MTTRQMMETSRDEVTALGRAARQAWQGPCRERDLVVQSLKAALAALVAWLIASHWLNAPLSFIAPWVAVLLVRSTVYESLAQALQQAVAITLGTVLATAGGMALGDPWLAMAVVLPVVLLLGSWPRLGDQGMYAATTALFTLTSPGPSLDSAVARVLESLLGAAVGVAVNMLVLPPVHLRDTHRAVAGAVQEAADTLRAVAEGLDEAWDHDRAQDWDRRARRLFRLLDEARAALRHSGESERLNPARRRRAEVRRMRAPYRRTLSVLEELADYFTDLTRTLAEAAAEEPTAPRPDSDALVPYQRFLSEVAEAVDAFGRTVLDEDDAGARDRLRRRVEEVRVSHDRLRRLLAGKPAGEPEWVALYGSLLMDARRLTDALWSEPPYDE
ncbi:FUSC family protein [Streptomyces griseosporeus]|uniref:FUSC family protein n=1 Tax=Streptomyces griseosporeus TaxID=1910 RepID=UPI00370027EE